LQAAVGGGPDEMAKKKSAPKQETFPEMDDPEIRAIEEAAEEYADGRDARMEATKVEVERKDKIIEAMQKAGKTQYRHGKVRVKLIPEKIKVKVKIMSDEELEKEQEKKAKPAKGKSSEAVSTAVQ
jgi:hypothetical protein